MKCVLAVLMVFSPCSLARAQSTAPPHDSATAQSAKAPPSADGKPAPAGKPDVAGKVELRDIKPQSSLAASPMVLKNTGPVSTEDVVRGVAQELAKQDAGATNGQSAGLSPANAQGGTDSTAKATPAQNPGQGPAAAGDAVMEFQPASSGAGAASSATVIEDGAPSKSPLKRVHGDLYGVVGADGHAAGGSVGATSKYVQSDQARSKAGQPQQ